MTSELAKSGGHDYLRSPDNFSFLNDPAEIQRMRQRDGIVNEVFSNKASENRPAADTRGVLKTRKITVNSDAKARSLQKIKNPSTWVIDADIIQTLKEYPGDPDIFNAVLNLGDRTAWFLNSCCKKTECSDFLKSIITDKDRALAVIKSSGKDRFPVYKDLIPENIKENPEFFLEALKELGNILSLHIPKALQKNRDFMVKLAGQVWSIVSDYKWKDDKDFVLDAFKHYVNVGNPTRFSVLDAVTWNGLCLEFVPDEFKSDPEIALAAVLNNWKAIQFLSDQLRDGIVIKSFTPPYTSSVLRRVISHFGGALNKKDFVLKAIKMNPISYFLTTEDLQKDPDVLLEAIKAGIGRQMPVEEIKIDDKEDSISYEIDQEWQRWASLCKDKGSIANAILSTLSKNLKEDKNFALQLVKVYGPALQELPLFKEDLEVVEAAVKQSPLALKYAGEKVKQNENFIRTVVPQKNLMYVTRGMMVIFCLLSITI